MVFSEEDHELLTWTRNNNLKVEKSQMVNLKVYD